MKKNCQNNGKILTMSEVKKKKKWVPRKDVFTFLLKSGSDIWIHLAMVALCIYGTLMIGSASMGLAVDDPMYLVKTVAKQIVFILIGYFCMGQFSHHFTLNSLKKSRFVVTIFFMEALLLSCIFFKASGGAHAWIRIPIPGFEVSIQPSEFAKIVCILIVAAFMGDVKKDYDSTWHFIRTPIFYICVYLFTVAIIQHDFGSMAVMLLITCVCMLIPNHPKMKPFQKILIGLFWVGVVLLIFIMSPAGEWLIEHMSFLDEYQRNRFLSAINPFEDIYGTSYQIVKGLVSFADGGWFGVGFGNSIRKYTDFPAANTDFILAILVEELGFVGFFVLIFLYGVIVFRLLMYANKIKSEKAKIILVGTAMYFLIHIFFNIGGVTALIPLTGVPLLMISSGGSSTLSIMFCVGIAQAIISAYNRGEIQ